MFFIKLSITECKFNKVVQRWDIQNKDTSYTPLKFQEYKNILSYENGKENNSKNY
jgi:hypothetical protein